MQLFTSHDDVCAPQVSDVGPRVCLKYLFVVAAFLASHTHKDVAWWPFLGGYKTIVSVGCLKSRFHLE